MNRQNKSFRQFYICTITRDGRLCDLKTYFGDYAEAALQQFMSHRRRAVLERRGLPTWFGTPTVCSNDRFKCVNEGYEIEASPLKNLLRQMSSITGSDAIERRIAEMEQGKLEVDPAFIRKLDRALFRIISTLEAAAGNR